jgi:hypothetical protein
MVIPYVLARAGEKDSAVSVTRPLTLAAFVDQLCGRLEALSKFPNTPGPAA